MYRWLVNPKSMLIVIMVMAVALLAACGGDDDTTTSKPSTTAVPKAKAEPTTAPAKQELTGTINIAIKELGPYTTSARVTESTVWLYVSTSTHETLLRMNPQGELEGKLLETWSVDDAGTTWTLKLKEGVPWHGDWGEITSDDVIHAANDHIRDGAVGSLTGVVERLFHANGMEGGGISKIDNYTFQLITDGPQFDMLSFGLSNPVTVVPTSKKQYDAEGEEVTRFGAVGTGPWTLNSSLSGQYWLFDAVEDHYRKSPHFAQLKLHEIPEESTRVANFQTGKIDSFMMAMDSKAAIDQTEDIRYMTIPNGATEHLGFYGNWYVGHGTDDQRPGYDPSLPWVSPNPDVNSPEWETARKVREALSIAIDRDLIVETLLGGEGAAQTLWNWENQISNLDPDLRRIEYDPERAKQLLIDAGYADGFKITLTTSIRGVAAEVETCAAISEFWEDIGIDTTISSVPYLTQGPLLSGRIYNQAACHGTAGRLDPLELYPVTLLSESGWSSGSDHPILDALIHEALVQRNDEDHFRVMNQAARFVYENVMETGLYSVNILWPLGPKLEEWSAHLDYGDTRAFGSYEYAQPRNR